MSRKRDSNWSKDEITVLLDSIMELTKMQTEDGGKRNTKEIFEFVSKRLGEKGYSNRAEPEKCRIKWKKMKEEYAHAKRARDGESRYKEAPGIIPFYERMEEIINEKCDNISPNSTFARRTSSYTADSALGVKNSLRNAASTNGATSTDNNDTSSTIITRSNVGSEFSVILQAAPIDGLNSSGNETNVLNSATTSNLPTHNQQRTVSNNSNHCTIYTAYNEPPNTATNMVANDSLNNQSSEQADISYRVGAGCRQITIFGLHDVDIKFRGDCVTINKIESGCPTSESQLR